MLPARCIQPACRNIEVSTPCQSCPCITSRGTRPQVTKNQPSAFSSGRVNQYHRNTAMLIATSPQVTNGVRPEGL